MKRFNLQKITKVTNSIFHTEKVQISKEEDEKSNDPYKIYCFWTGNNKMSDRRVKCLRQLQVVSNCKVILITPENLSQYLLPDQPLHPAYNYLCHTHKADYLRTYFMHFKGGAYSDIKCTTGSWKEYIDLLRNEESIWAIGYQETKEGVAYVPYIENWKELIGNCAYVFRPQTPLTTLWYNQMIELLDNKLNLLMKNPARHPQDSSEQGGGYPIEWNEMLGRIFHKWVYDYRDHIRRTLPTPIFNNYR